jgi:hypothetical protein
MQLLRGKRKNSRGVIKVYKAKMARVSGMKPGANILTMG